MILRVVLLDSLVMRDNCFVLVMNLSSFVLMLGNIREPSFGLRLALNVELPPSLNVPPKADIVLSRSELEPKVRLASISILSL